MTASLWIKYLEPLQLLELLDHFIDFQISEGRRVATVVLETLASLEPSDWPNELEYVRQLPRLLSMRSAWDSSLLDRVIANIVESSLPMHLEGIPLPSIHGKFASLTARSSSRWTGHFSSAKALDNIDIRQFLSRDISESTTRIVTGLLYRQPSARPAVLRWMSSGNPIMDVTHFLPMIYVLLDVSLSTGINIHEAKIFPWRSLVPKLAAIIVDQHAPCFSRSWAQHCLMKILLASEAEMSSFIQILTTEVKSLSKKPTAELLALAIWLWRQFGSDANQVVSEVLDAGISSSIDWMADGMNEVCDDEFLQLLCEYNVLLQWRLSVVHAISSSVIGCFSSSSQAQPGGNCIISDSSASYIESCCTTVGRFVPFKLSSQGKYASTISSRANFISILYYSLQSSIASCKVSSNISISSDFVQAVPRMKFGSC
jgi:hypothetical protein